MADFGVEVNTIQFETAMQALKAAVRKGLIDPQYGTLTVQARLLAERCQSLTPPANVGQGNAAVARDLTRIYCPQSPSTWGRPAYNKIVRTDDRFSWDVLAEGFNDSRGLRNTKAVAFSESMHAQNKNKKGKVFRAKYGNFGMVTLGPQARLARDYITNIKKRVGWARGGWNIGILSLGGTIKAGWVSRHSVNRGKIIDGRSDADPYIAVINDTGWARSAQTNAQRVVRLAISGRARDMQHYADGIFRDVASGVMKSRGGFGGFSAAIPAGM